MESPGLTSNGHLSCKSQSGRIGYKLTCQTTHPDLGGFFPIISPWVCLCGLWSVDALPEVHCPRDSAHGPRITKSGARELNNVLAENQKILMTIIEKCGHWGLPNAEPEGWKNADPEDCQKLSPRIAKSRYQELNNVIAVNQKILIMIVEKSRCWELKNADSDDYQKWSPRVDNMRTLNITKSGARELQNAEPEN